MTLEIIGHDFSYEAECVIRIFYPMIKLIKTGEALCEHLLPDKNAFISTRITKGENSTNILVEVRLGEFSKKKEESLDNDLAEIEYERSLCMLLFLLLCEKENHVPAWGMLTGVRPVRLIHPLLENKMSDKQIIDYFAKNYRASEPKIRLAIETAKNEASVLKLNKENSFSLYIGIPFCPSRCLYCSFVSHDVKSSLKLIPQYVKCLCEEIKHTAYTAKECGLNLHTVYIGGGTPTALDAEDLSAIMSAVDKYFDLSQILEYTVEAGRPDTITKEKLEAIKAGKADRISINPQTMNDDVLKIIGRNHSSADIEKAYKMAECMGFSAINMDLIAGLPGDTPQIFLNGLNRVIEMNPQNITVHTLTVKRSSELRDNHGAFKECDYDISALLDTAKENLTHAGYVPYYMYRQKGTRQNMENTGYAKNSSFGIYNIYIMEEVHTVLSCGAGGVTKLCLGNNLERIYNFKYPHEYLSRFDEIIKRKRKVTDFYERNR